MIKVNKIYILCPSQLNTGGPLAMHQLGNKLKELNHDVNMYYLPITENPVHDNYLNYNVPFVKQVEDSAKNLIIAPEVWTEKLTLFKKIQKSIWWLSIDNFYASSKPIINKIIDMIKGERRFKWNHFSSYYHFTQSEYANQYLKKKSLESVYMLSDYIDKKFIEKDHKSTDIHLRKDRIIYNPKKGIDFTKSLIESAPELQWTPIQNMSPDEVKELLTTSKLYVDFGNHPGKDRIPREAALCGCCVLTGKKGSANYFKDIPIPEKFKFDETKNDINSIIELIKCILMDFKTYNLEFEDYRSQILTQEEVFRNEIQNIFVKAY